MTLAIVIPVFNEELTIESLIKNVDDLLIAENISHEFIIVNDGSTDNSLAILQSLSTVIPRIKIISSKNSGHGPSLLKAYQLALEYDWIFQIDADNQYDLSTFKILWKNRNQYDILIASRKERNASMLRNFATAVSQYLVIALYGNGIKDINSPYRLMRAQKLAIALKQVPVDSFAPNILIVAYF